jgi:hypothetical protein
LFSVFVLISFSSFEHFLKIWANFKFEHILNWRKFQIGANFSL